LVDAPAARALAPGIAPGCLGGVYAPRDGQAEAVPATEAFARAARRLGARVEEGMGARVLLAERGRVVGVERGDGGREACETVIVTAGAWSAPLLAGVGVTLPIETRPLQMLLTEPAAPALRPVLGAFDRPLSLKQLDDGAYLIGGGWPARVTDHAANRYEVLPESVAGSLETTRAVYSALDGCRVARSWAGLEAFTPDRLPILGPVPGVAGVLVAAGFSGHGFALSPAIGDILARLTLGLDPLPGGSGLELRHFRFDRSRR
ncbi:MAG TPA: FAD-binding oxidoreductase, partial [Methylomirabilota bacterium]|nr:FAD-binding oxidoreductase [Methylomirabilota bacterium]